MWDLGLIGLALAHSFRPDLLEFLAGGLPLPHIGSRRIEESVIQQNFLAQLF